MGDAAQATLVFLLAAPLGSADGNTGPFTFMLQGRLAFQGERLERVGRNGNTLRLEGSGKFDGQPGFRFSIDARDGEHGGAVETDRLTVRIEHADLAARAQAASLPPTVLNDGVADRKPEAQRAWSEERDSGAGCAVPPRM